MNYEILTLKNAEKLKKYDDLLLKHNNIVQLLKNIVVLNKESLHKYKRKDDKEKVLIASARVSIAQELLKIIEEM
jgi:hypothetical protein